MTDTRHTPGPWEVVEFGDYSNWVVKIAIFARGEDGGVVCGLPVGTGIPLTEQKATAHVIAQAPTLATQRDALLEAAESVAGDLEHLAPHLNSQRLLDLRATLTHAIAQARGEE